MADVFISYKRKYRSEVDLLVSRLGALGISVWYDAGLIAGEQYRSEIKKELNAANAVIACWTPECFVEKDEGWVRWEAQFARDRGKLVPVHLRLTELEPPFHLDHVENISGWTESDGRKDEDVWRRVLAALGVKLGRAGLVELDGALAPARAAGITVDLNAADQFKAHAGKLAAAQRNELATALADWAEQFRKERIAKRVGELAAVARPPAETAAMTSPMAAPAMMLSAPAEVTGPQLDAKGKPLVGDAPIRVIPALTYGFSMLRAAPQFLLSLGAVALLLNGWSASEMQGKMEGLREIQSIADPQLQLQSLGQFYAKLAVPALVSLTFGWILQTSLMRALVRGERVAGFLGLALGADEFRVIGINLLTWLAGILAYIGSVIAAMLLGGVAGIGLSLAGLGELGGAVGVAIGAISVFVFMGLYCARVTPMAAATIARRKIAWTEGWRLSRKAGWPILMALTMLFVPMMLLGLAIQGLGASIGMVRPGEGIANLSSPMGYLLLLLQSVIAIPFLASWYGIGAYVFVQRATVAKTAVETQS